MMGALYLTVPFQLLSSEVGLIGLFDLLNHFLMKICLMNQADNPIARAIANAESVTFLIKEFLD